MAERGPYIEATPQARDDFTGEQTTRAGALVARSPAARELVVHPLILAACDRHQLHLTQVIRIGLARTCRSCTATGWPGAASCRGLNRS